MSTLRGGFTTGACAAAASHAAARLLEDSILYPAVTIQLGEDDQATLPIFSGGWIRQGSAVCASVIKDAGDDPDVTHGAEIEVRLEPLDAPDGTLLFAAGKGVGTVTKAGLALPPGTPAINPGPRKMIEQAIRAVTQRALRVTISVPTGEALAAKTFNPRLGIVGGISILGTSGRVRPFSHEALRDALRCSFDVAMAAGHEQLAFVPGHIGRRAARAHTDLPEEAIIEVSNEWGFMLALAKDAGHHTLTLVGHPGKLAKLAGGHWDTHSSRSPSAAPFTYAQAQSLFPAHSMHEPDTVEAVFQQLDPPQRAALAKTLAGAIAHAVLDEYTVQAEVILVDLQGARLG